MSTGGRLMAEWPQGGGEPLSVFRMGISSLLPAYHVEEGLGDFKPTISQSVPCHRSVFLIQFDAQTPTPQFDSHNTGSTRSREGI